MSSLPVVLQQTQQGSQQQVSNFMYLPGTTAPLFQSNNIAAGQAEKEENLLGLNPPSSSSWCWLPIPPSLKLC